MPYLAYWVDDDDCLRSVEDSTPEEKVVFLDEKFCTSTEKIVKTILEIYKEKGIRTDDKDNPQ